MSDHKIDELNRFIKDEGIEFFSAKETLTLQRLGVQAPVPHVRMWPNIIPALVFADRMRAIMGHPLTIANGYRPTALNNRAGGKPKTLISPGSQHLYYRALDIQLPRVLMGRREAQQQLYQVAAELFLTYTKMQIGFGIYRRNGGDRVHIDVGFRRRYWGGPRKRWIKDLLAENR